MASTLGLHNPLRYCGYVYDRETGLYYPQSCYYNPEWGRFINADALISTSQGIVGNNMFVYCLNSPLAGCDPCGTCFHRWDFWNDCDSCGGRTLGDKCNDFLNWVGDLDIAITTGYYVSLNTGIWNISGSVELAIDSEFNVQINGTLSFELSTAGELSVSAGRTSSVFFVPDVSFLEGGTDYVGGSKAVMTPELPIAIAGGLNVGRTSDGYWGGALSAGVTPATRFGTELHGGHAETWRLLPRINLRSLLFE